MNKFRPYILLLVVAAVSILTYFVSVMPDRSVISTLSGLGITSLSKTWYLVFNILIGLLFCFLFALEGVRGRLKPKKVMKTTGVVFAAAISSYLLGKLVAMAFESVTFNNAMIVIIFILLLALTIFIYIKRRASAIRMSSSSMRASAGANAIKNHAFTVLYGTLSLVFVMSILVGSIIHDNIMFFIPLCFATVAMVLYHLTDLRLWLLAAVAVILIHATSFIYLFAVNPANGDLGLVLMSAFLDLIVLIPLADLYLLPQRRR